MCKRKKIWDRVQNKKTCEKTNKQTNIYVHQNLYQMNEFED